MDGGTEETSGVWESSIFDLEVIIRAYRFLNSPYTIYLLLLLLLLLLSRFSHVRLWDLCNLEYATLKCSKYKYHGEFFYFHKQNLFGPRQTGVGLHDIHSSQEKNHREHDAYSLF